MMEQVPVSVEESSKVNDEALSEDKKMEQAESETPGDSTMDKQTLLAVLQFLKKNNLQGTENLLRKEAKLSEDIKIPEEGGATESDVSQALAAYKSEGDPSLYEDYYTNLRNFVDKSLDVHKCELAMVLYPVFVHMYLELVYNNHEDQAKIFFDKLSIEQESYYHDDLKQLSTVTKAEHMRGNQLLENFKTSKFVIKMSRDSYNHLKRFLQENKFKLLLNIVQEHLFIDVFDGVPRNKQQIDATAGSMSGEARKEANKTKVYYGLLKEPEINIQLEDDEEEPPGEDRPKKKKAKKDPVLMKKAKNDPNAPPLARIPLPELRDADKLEKAKAYREAAKRVAVNSQQLPSICFYTLLNAHQGVTSLEICDDSSLMSAGFADSQIKIWSLNSQKLKALKSPQELDHIDKEADDVLVRMMDERTASDSKSLHGHSGPVYASSFSPDRNYNISCSEDGTLRLWSLQTWTNLVCYKGHNYPIWDVKFSPMGHYFMSGGFDRTARLWSTDHYQPLRIFAGHLADVECVQFHPNCNYVATGSADRTVRLWDIATGNCVRIMTGHKGSIYSMVFSPDGKYLASSGSDKTILLWDVSNGDQVGQMKGHSDTIYSMAFSREGSTLASGGLDNCVKLWDIGKVLEDQESEGGISGLVNESSVYQVASFPTKSTHVFNLHFTRKNLLLAAGPFVSH